MLLEYRAIQRREHGGTIVTAAKAVAHSNIALIKYWGKSNVERNLPAVPSLSMTLDALSTTTRVEFDASLTEDAVTLDGAAISGRPRERVCRVLDRVRERAGVGTRASVESANSFPTAAGLASSASGFAALVMAATRAAGLELSNAELSAWARQASVSAARSIYGGFAELDADAESAAPVAAKAHWDLGMVIALTARGPKSVSSTDGMLHTAKTSPYYPAWVEAAPALFQTARAAIERRDLDTLGEAMEHSTLLMHASMFGARPAVIYFAPPTLGVLDRIRQLRSDGVRAYFTMDAGPHVKVLARREDLGTLDDALRTVPGVVRTLQTGIGPDAHCEIEP